MVSNVVPKKWGWRWVDNILIECLKKKGHKRTEFIFKVSWMCSVCAYIPSPLMNTPPPLFPVPVAFCENGVRSSMRN